MPDNFIAIPLLTQNINIQVDKKPLPYYLRRQKILTDTLRFSLLGEYRDT